MKSLLVIQFLSISCYAHQNIILDLASQEVEVMYSYGNFFVMEENEINVVKSNLVDNTLKNINNRTQLALYFKEGHKMKISFNEDGDYVLTAVL